MNKGKVNSESRFEQGLRTRREVLGDAYVDRAIAESDDVARPMQTLVTEYCWHEIWNRPGLDRRSRSLLNLGMLAALNRPHEFKIHVRGALANGLSREEIVEIVLQVAVYCGIPAGVDSMQLVNEVFADIDAQLSPSSRGAGAA